MKDRIIAGIDLGSSSVRLAAARVIAGGERRDSLSFVGAVEVPSYGISKGSIKSIEDVVSSVSACLEQAERQVGIPIPSALIGLASPAIQCQIMRGVVGVTHQGNEIRSEDVDRSVESAKASINPANFEVIHVLPRRYSIDGQQVVKDPVGMQGIRLESEVLVVQAQASYIRNIYKVAERARIDIESCLFSPLAAAYAVTTPRDREVGVIVVNIGAATTSFSIYEEGDLLHASVIPIGSDHITADIAIGLRTSLESAERIKKEVITAYSEEVSRQDMIDLAHFGGTQSEIVGLRFVSDVAQARAEELFERIEKELKAIGRSGMLPAGIILVGGGAKLRGMIQVAKQVLRLPARLGAAQHIEASAPELLRDPAFAPAVGLVQWGFEDDQRGYDGDYSGGSGEVLKKLGSKLHKVYKSFLP